MTKTMMVSACSSDIGHFDGHGGPPVKHEAHPPMQHVQGYSRSHWTPPLGDYSLHIAPAATSATVKQTTINKYTQKGGHVDGCGGAPVQYRALCPMEEIQGFTRSHCTLPSGKYYVR
jgi:hypothetical protein